MTDWLADLIREHQPYAIETACRRCEFYTWGTDEEDATHVADVIREALASEAAVERVAEGLASQTSYALATRRELARAAVEALVGGEG